MCVCVGKRSSKLVRWQIPHVPRNPHCDSRLVAKQIGNH